MSVLHQGCRPRAEGSPRRQRPDRRRRRRRESLLRHRRRRLHRKGLDGPGHARCRPASMAEIEKEIGDSARRPATARSPSPTSRAASSPSPTAASSARCFPRRSSTRRRAHPRPARINERPMARQRSGRHPPDDVSGAQLRSPPRRRQGSRHVPRQGEAGSRTRNASCWNSSDAAIPSPRTYTGSRLG